MSLIQRGIDTGIEKILPDTKITVNKGQVNGNLSYGDGIDIKVDIMSGDLCTKRNVYVTNGSISKKFISFKFNMYNDTPTPDWDGWDNIIYPQRHVVNIIISGSNGSNGILLKVPGIDISESRIIQAASDESEYVFPRSISNATQIKYIDGSSSIEDWNVREYDGWDTTLFTSPEDYSHLLSADVSKIYTRPSDITTSLTFAAKYRNRGTNRYVWWQYINRYLNFLYSRNDKVIIRFTFELNSANERYLTIEKFQGGNSLT